MTTEQRLERLERENRWMRRITVVAVAVAVVSLASSVYVLTRERDRGEVLQESAAREARAAAEALLAEHRERTAEALARVAALQCQRYLDFAELWRVITGKYPRSLQAMEAGLPAGNKIAGTDLEVAFRNHIMVFFEVEPDPWGNPYVLEVSANEREISVWSFGPNGKKDGEDDTGVSMQTKKTTSGFPSEEED